jgi:bacterioferritin
LRRRRREIRETVDTKELIERLNEDLQTEYQSIVQYVQHTATIKGAEYTAIVEELGEHLSQELEHAQILATQIDFLGGTPTVEVPPIPNHPDGASALQADLELEERQLDRYRTRYQEANDLGLPDVAEALRPLLQQTQDHVNELRDALGK